MPTLAHYSNAASDVFPGGSVTFDVVFETYLNSGQACNASGVTIGIAASGAPDSGSGTPVATTSAGVQQLGMGLFTYTWNPPQSTVPGSYLVTWTGTRASDSTVVTYTQAVNVAPDPESVPLPGVYASVAQYRAWSGDGYTPAQIIQVKLQRATEDIDVALVAAVYRTDADGMPLDPQLANVLVRATSAQVQYLLAQNDDSGIKREYSSTSVGGVSATRAASQQGGALPRLGPRALSILRVAGVLPSAPLVNWLPASTDLLDRPRNGAHRTARNGCHKPNLTYCGAPVMTMPLHGTSPASDDYVAAAVAANIPYSSPYASGAIAETIPAYAATTAVTLTSGDLYIFAIHLGQGETVGHVGFVTTTTAGATLNHWWTCVLDNTYTVQAASADQTSGAIAASTWFSLAMAAPYTATYNGLYYLGVMISNNAGTQPTLCGTSAGPLIAMMTGTGHPNSMYGGQSSTSQTTAPAVGTAVTAPTATIGVPYLYATN